MVKYLEVATHIFAHFQCLGPVGGQHLAQSHPERHLLIVLICRCFTREPRLLFQRLDKSHDVENLYDLQFFCRSLGSLVKQDRIDAEGDIPVTGRRVLDKLPIEGQRIGRDRCIYVDPS